MFENNRYCVGCGHEHAYLYPCEKYSKKTLKEIYKETQKYKKRLENIRWCVEQIERGAELNGLIIQRYFSGFSAKSTREWLQNIKLLFTKHKILNEAKAKIQLVEQRQASAKTVQKEQLHYKPQNKK